eukprot:gene2031-1538_t
MKETTSPNGKQNFHEINLQWKTSLPENSRDINADLKISVSSRKIKNQEESPSNILFRTHHYDFLIKPNENFVNFYGKDAKFAGELQLVRPKGIVNNCAEDFVEVVQKEKKLEIPVVNYFVKEENGTCEINLVWPTERKSFSWKGNFSFLINFYHKTDEDTYQIVCSKISSEFSIISKPDVYLKKIREKKNDGNSLKNLTDILESQIEK